MKPLPWWIFPSFCVLVTALGGCAFLDSLFGVKPDGTPTGGGGVLGTVGSIVGMWIPGATAVVTGLGGIYAALRGKRWKDAAVSTFKTIEAGAEAGKQVTELKKDLATAHRDAGVYELVKAVVSKPKAPATT